MKTRFQFINLPEELQATYLMDHGKFLIRHHCEDSASDLYAVHDFFVEVLYDYQERNITGFEVMHGLELADKYLDEIDLEVFV